MLGCNPEAKEEQVDTGQEEVLPTYCESLGLSERQFDTSGTTGDFGEIVPDFTFNLLDEETWSLSEN